jgi:predicted ester cyclase
MILFSCNEIFVLLIWRNRMKGRHAMPLSPAEMDRKLDAHFAYEAADDVEGVLHTLAPDVEHDIVGAPIGPTHGPEAARGFYEALFADLADGHVRSQRRLYGDNFMVDDSVWTGTAPGAPFGIAGGGRPLEFRLLHVIEFADSGQIQRENVWVDLGAIQRQLAA